MFDSVWMVFIDWRLEVYAAAALAFLGYLKWRYRDNDRVAAFIKWTSDRIATNMENNPQVTYASVHDPLSKKQALRRKVRRELATQVRKANRGKPK